MEGSFLILVADSNPRNRSVLRNYLSTELHHRVVEAASGPEVLKVTEEQKPDLLLMDSGLGEMDGYETAKKLKANPSTRMIRILLLAPQGEKEKRLFAIECGADEMLIKPIDKLELLIRVESYLRIKYFYDQLLFERERVQKMREDFLAMITHDLKTPLTTIIGNTHLLLEATSKPELRSEYLKAIDMASRSLLILVNNLLNVMRLDAGMMNVTLENFAIQRLAEEVVAMMKPMAERKGIQLVYTPGAPIMVHADMEKIRQVLSNLLSNAIKFTPEHGTVTLSFSNEGEKRMRAAVSDTGPGIPKEDQVRLFQKFSQKRGERGGTGLGLYIVRKMLDLHGAEITLESQPGKGAIFSFELERASVESPKR